MCYGYSLGLWQRGADKGATVFLKSKQDAFYYSLTNKSVVKLLKHYIIIIIKKHLRYNIIFFLILVTKALKRS